MKVQIDEVFEKTWENIKINNLLKIKDFDALEMPSAY